MYFRASAHERHPRNIFILMKVFLAVNVTLEYGPAASVCIHADADTLRTPEVPGVDRVDT